MVEGFVHLDRARMYDISSEQTHSCHQNYVIIIILGISDVPTGSARLLSIRDNQTRHAEQADNRGNILALEKVSSAQTFHHHPAQSSPTSL